ncbi:Gfo/Idh/MocA family protein [Pseudoduganella namucuonensis]|uniref:Predicted dehydrogenase n=1 Tax=Pseudoduganella namucuonensis TaxID=1035707 RepID=A0A1I7H0G5_9BURK|nr:Gfo/Idh/MocA family oxidoreductase [Pseudoduganella namucuonensis]SFU54150.1 Predicted dehydrogenase [Pseudoduganella namucuonensis]
MDKAVFPGRVRLGMVGGGEGAFIGAVHRHAARLDDRYELVAGALSSTAEASQRSGRALGLDPARIYDSYGQMAKAESAREDGIEAVSIVTPNHMHAPVARAFLEAGIHVICDKPVTTNSADARMLKALAEERGLIFAVTHNYSAYPLVRHAQRMVREGALGQIRVVQVEYAQDWLAEALEQGGQKQAAWRTDPAKAGGGAIGDIGSHAWQLADTIVGAPVEALAAELSSFVPGRVIDDDVQVLLRYAGGARGMLWASQVAPGHANDLRIRVYGSKGGIEWAQQHPNELRWTPLGEPTRIVERGSAAMNAAGARVSRVPAGHTEGYIDAFAALYSEIASHLLARRCANSGAAAGDARFPTIDDGLRGVLFIEAVQASSRAGGVWVSLSD